MDEWVDAMSGAAPTRRAPEAINAMMAKEWA